jgi:transposase
MARMPALCAANHNPILRDFYRSLIARNKPRHVALTAVIRKLICLMNRILADPDFQPS